MKRRLTSAAKLGTLIIIGGHEDRTGEKLILNEVAKRTGSGALAIVTVASSEPEEMYEIYEKAFRDLGLRKLVHLTVADRKQALSQETFRLLDGVCGIFLTGGDQLKITSRLGDTPIFQQLHRIYESGGVIAGTSAGASAMCETMLTSGESERSSRIEDNLRMAPGLGLINRVIVDQHFAERGRMGRLLGAIAQNPANLGIGLDENTAIIVEADQTFSVVGKGAVYLIDGCGVTHSNLVEEAAEQVLSLYDVKLHVLSHQDLFSLTTRQPEHMPACSPPPPAKKAPAPPRLTVQQKTRIELKPTRARR